MPKFLPAVTQASVVHSRSVVEGGVVVGFDGLVGREGGIDALELDESHENPTI